MEQEKQYRHELKYEIPYGDYAAARGRLQAVMQSDPHTGPDGRYRIRSIYFDNAADKALREKIDGVARREKFRIRYYNDDLSYISLEKKMKINNLCLKMDAPLILDGDIRWMKESDRELIKELYAKMNYQGLRPKVLVSYTREPYIYRAGNVRVTFDSQIRTSLYSREFFGEGIRDISATEDPGMRIMEVKYDAFLPGIIQDIIRCTTLRAGAFSKYGACRRYG